MKSSDDRARRIHPLTLSIISLLLLFTATSLLIRERGAKAATHSKVSKLSEVSEDVTETTTLTDPFLWTWQWNTTYKEGPACNDVPFVPIQKPPEGQVITGFIYQYDHYFHYVEECFEQKAAFFNGTIRFDLSTIASKAPAPRIFVTDARLNFKQIDSVTFAPKERVLRQCGNQLLIATVDWQKPGYESQLVPGADPVPITCGPANVVAGELRADCSVNVRSTVNNWLNGSQDNFGFVMKGETAERAAKDVIPIGGVCQSRYGAFSLTVSYKYDKETATKPKDTYPLVCRGTEALKIMDFDGPVPFRWVGFNFIPGTKPANDGLLPGQCSWLDRGMRPGEPARLAQPIEYTQVWNKELNSSDSYWTFNVYNAGGQLQATGAERNKRIIVPLLRTNVALASNGGTASASSTSSPFSAAAAIDGEHRGLNWLSGGGWQGAGPTNNDWLQVDFSGYKMLDEIDVFMIQDDYASPVEPTLATPANKYSLTNFRVQYWNKFGNWSDVPPGLPVIGNSNAWKQFKFPPLRTNKIRVLVSKTPDGWSRIAEIEAWGH